MVSSTGYGALVFSMEKARSMKINMFHLGHRKAV